MGVPVHSSWDPTCSSRLGALRLRGCRKAIWALSNKLLKKGLKLRGGARVAVLCPWDLQAVVSGFAELCSKLQI